MVRVSQTVDIPENEIEITAIRAQGVGGQDHCLDEKRLFCLPCRGETKEPFAVQDREISCQTPGQGAEAFMGSTLSGRTGQRN